jgi:hypothetical protein
MESGQYGVKAISLGARTPQQVRDEARQVVEQESHALCGVVLEDRQVALGFALSRAHEIRHHADDEQTRVPESRHVRDGAGLPVGGDHVRIAFEEWREHRGQEIPIAR